MQTYSAADLGSYFARSIQSGTIDGVVSIVFPSHSFTYPGENVGLVQNFIVLDELAKHLG